MARDEVVAYLERYAAGFAGARARGRRRHVDRAGFWRRVRAADVGRADRGADGRPGAPAPTSARAARRERRRCPPTCCRSTSGSTATRRRCPPGRVLVVGSGQSGCQIAEELHEAGRDVFLACGRAPWVPRRIGDHDVIWWGCRDRVLRRAGQLAAPSGAAAGRQRAVDGRRRRARPALPHAAADGRHPARPLHRLPTAVAPASRPISARASPGAISSTRMLMNARPRDGGRARHARAADRRAAAVQRRRTRAAGSRAASGPSSSPAAFGPTTRRGCSCRARLTSSASRSSATEPARLSRACTSSACTSCASASRRC